MPWLFDVRQGEEQKKLDVLSNEVFVKALVGSGRTVRNPPCPFAIVRLSSECFTF